MKNFSFIIPVTLTEWLEVSTKLISKQTKLIELKVDTNVAKNPNAEITDYPIENIKPYHSNSEEEILRSLNATHQSIFQILQNQRAFMCATATGFQFLHMDQVICFEYIKERKSWDLTLKDGSKLQLKRNTTADDILNFSLRFVRINQQAIINIDFLHKIENNMCVLTHKQSNASKLNISRNYMKSLQERVEVI